MEVTSLGPQTMQKAQGETVKLGCTYTPAPQDTGELDIEWSNLSPDMTQKDQLVGRRGMWLPDGDTGTAGLPWVTWKLNDLCIYLPIQL